MSGAPHSVVSHLNQRTFIRFDQRLASERRARDEMTRRVVARALLLRRLAEPTRADRNSTWRA